MNITEVLGWFNDYFINCCVIYWVQCLYPFVAYLVSSLYRHSRTSLLYHVCVRCCFSCCVSSLCSRSLAAISLSLSSLWICAGGQWSGPPRTNQARSTSSRCWTHWTCSQLSALVFSVILVQTCQNELSCFGFLSFPPLAEDPSGNRAPDTVWDRQCHQWLVPRPYRDHQHTCEWRTQKLYL